MNCGKAYIHVNIDTFLSVSQSTGNFMWKKNRDYVPPYILKYEVSSKFVLFTSCNVYHVFFQE